MVILFHYEEDISKDEERTIRDADAIQRIRYADSCKVITIECFPYLNASLLIIFQHNSSYMLLLDVNNRCCVQLHTYQKCMWYN